jgi:hypothetical protein
MKLLGTYINGNYRVTIFDDGTKVRENDLDFFRADAPESMDIKITNQCDVGCPMCHENSTKDGLHGDILNPKFLSTLHPYTELAIGGGNPLAHPDLVTFLKWCKEHKLIPSMTINQTHFMKDYDVVKALVEEKLIYGLGVSLTNPSAEFIERIKEFPNAVIHVIAGLVSISDLEKLSNKGLKILILGYKQFRRGADLYSRIGSDIEERIQTLKVELAEVLNMFKVVSFDNLAIKQLDPSRLLTKEEYDEFFMGEDGFATMYIDLVKKEFARSSTSTDRYPLMDNITDMFEVIRTK